MRRLYVTLVVVGLVVLAGCAGLGGDSDGDAAVEGASIEYPSGYDETGVADSDAAIQAHRRGLSESAGVDVTLETTESGEQELHLEQRELIDNQNNVGLSRTEVGQTTQTSYRTADGIVYTRQSREGNVRYQRDDTGFGADQSNIGDAIDLLVAVEMELTTEEHEELTLFGYETDESQTATFNDEDSTIESAQLLVDDSGRVHTLSIAVTVETDDGGTIERTVDADFEYGAIDVPEPDWLDEAIEVTEDSDDDDF